jgi:hypothetical protein
VPEAAAILTGFWHCINLFCHILCSLLGHLLIYHVLDASTNQHLDALYAIISLRNSVSETRFMGGLDMSYSLDINIRERLAAYLANEISLREFEDWFFPETWDVDQLGNLALTNLVYGIKLCLAEFSNGDWTEGELRNLLRPFMMKHGQSVLYDLLV